MDCAARHGPGGPSEETATSEEPSTRGRPGVDETAAGTAPQRGGRDRSAGRLTWLLPALTFVVGVVLGAVVVAAIDSGGGAGTAADGSTAGPGGGTTATPTPSAGAPKDTTATMTVPAACAALAGDARDAAGLLEQAATAARDLDAKALADVARRMQVARDRLTAQADACQGAAPSLSVSSG
jgi:hypothetical protein